ncbi:MAG: FAD-dependent oxidoreductase [Candidatus Shapirobacteria bacterium]
MNIKKVAIIGGGLGGLVLGYELIKEGIQITILEKEKDLGGLVSGFKIDQTNLEKTYHHFFKTDKDLIQLIKEVGLENKIGWYKNTTGVYWNKTMYPFLTAVDLLKFKPLDLISKVRMGFVALMLKYDKNWDKYGKVTADKWMEKAVGRKAYEIVWQPLIKGKFHNHYNKISMAWLWSRIHTRGNSRNEKGEEILGYLDGSFKILIEKIEKIIEEKGGVINLNTEINDLKTLEKDYDLVIDTRPNKDIDYLGAINVVFSSNKSLSPYYWHNINDTDSPFVALIQHTNLIDKSNYSNKHIYYLGAYLPQGHKYFKWSDKKIEKDFLNYLTKIFPKFNQKQVDEVKTFKFKYAQQIVDTDYALKIPPYKISNKLWQLNFAQIYPQDRGMNFAVKEAKKMVKEIIKKN